VTTLQQILNGIEMDEATYQYHADRLWQVVNKKLRCRKETARCLRFFS